jgi:hypothetical protein
MKSSFLAYLLASLTVIIIMIPMVYLTYANNFSVSGKILKVEYKEEHTRFGDLEFCYLTTSLNKRTPVNNEKDIVLFKYLINSTETESTEQTNCEEFIVGNNYSFEHKQPSKLKGTPTTLEDYKIITP